MLLVSLQGLRAVPLWNQVNECFLADILRLCLWKLPTVYSIVTFAGKPWKIKTQRQKSRQKQNKSKTMIWLLPLFYVQHLTFSTRTGYLLKSCFCFLVSEIVSPDYSLKQAPISGINDILVMYVLYKHSGTDVWRHMHIPTCFVTAGQKSRPVLWEKLNVTMTRALFGLAVEWGISLMLCKHNQENIHQNLLHIKIKYVKLLYINIKSHAVLPKSILWYIIRLWLFILCNSVLKTILGHIIFFPCILLSSYSLTVASS